MSFPLKVFKIIFGFAAIMLCALGSGCATPKIIEGRKVVATRWVDGKLVYVLAPPDEAEKAEIRAEANGLRKLNDEIWVVERTSESPKK